MEDRVPYITNHAGNAAKPVTFDLESVYDNEIAPLMDKIIAICGANSLPMIASFCIQPNKLCTTVMLSNERAPWILKHAVNVIFLRQEMDA